MVIKTKNEVEKIFIGTEGIKTVYQGDSRIYERPGGFIYITVQNNTEED